MSLRNATPVRFSPSGLSDTLDSTNTPPGMCSQLANLIPDPTTKNLWQCRPAALQTTDFTGFTTPGFISVQKVIGTKIFGMIASALNGGHDQPFAYDLVTNTFATITGITALNTPISPATRATVSSSSIAMRAKVSRMSRPEATGSGLPSGPCGLT